MKLKFRLLVVLFVSIALVYTACKKSSTAPALAPKAVASQVALNLYQTLFGGFGGYSVLNGANLPENLVQNSVKGRKVNDFGDGLCGLVVDTTYKAATIDDGTNSATVSGDVSFSFICANSVFSGFTTKDDLNITIATPQLKGAFSTNENLTVLILKPNDDNSSVSLTGALGFSGDFTYLTGSKQSGTAGYNYNFKSIIIDSNAAIDSGSATFSTKGTGATGAWDYSGTITFLGGGKATITINGTAYNVDLNNGTVS